MIMWLIGLMLLGVLFAFPLKRRFINEEQMPFPEGRACGVVMDTLHSGGTGRSVLPAKLLVIFSIIAGLLKLGQSHALMEKIRLGFLSVPELLDEWYYRLAERFDETFVVVSGDALTDVDIGGLIAFHRERDALATIALRRVFDTSEFGVVVTDEGGNIKGFHQSFDVSDFYAFPLEVQNAPSFDTVKIASRHSLR